VCHVQAVFGGSGEFWGFGHQQQGTTRQADGKWSETRKAKAGNINGKGWLKSYPGVGI